MLFYFKKPPKRVIFQVGNNIARKVVAQGLYFLIMRYFKQKSPSLSGLYSDQSEYLLTFQFTATNTCTYMHSLQVL